MRGIDTPEIKTDDGCEYTAALAARREVRKILKKARRIDLRHIGRGKYFRIVANTYVDGKSLGRHLLNKGLAVKYDGGTRPTVNWCP